MYPALNIFLNFVVKAAFSVKNPISSYLLPFEVFGSGVFEKALTDVPVQSYISGIAGPASPRTASGTRNNNFFLKTISICFLITNICNQNQFCHYCSSLSGKAYLVFYESMDTADEMKECNDMVFKLI